MISNRIYYRLKPYLPLSLRIRARRIVAQTQRRIYTETWPINETAARMPANWPGWPQGKKFAFVLTHDVEGPSGLAKCRQLMELEMEMGFRSSFNFIPEGDYAVRRGGSERASVTAPTQRQAIEKAEKLDPKAAVLVERVRDTSVGGRDKWRKP